MKQNTNILQNAIDLMKLHNIRFCAAESCTGGLLLSTLTDVSGSSAYVLGGVVTYSNSAKQQLVGVQEATLIQHGAVSEETAREMVIGVYDLFDANLAISITGIAGPGGGTPEKPVGLVYIGAKYHDTVVVRRYLWQGNRAENKAYSVSGALELITELITNHTETV